MSFIADQLLGEARRRRVRLWLDENGRLRYDGSPAMLDDRFVRLLTDHGQRIGERLGADAPPLAAPHHSLLPGGLLPGGAWLKPLTAGNGRAVVYLLPAAGAGPGSYSVWRDTAPEGLDVVAVHAPGREERFTEPPVTSMPLLAERVAREIAAAADRPFALFGHSAGGRVAREVAKRLASTGSSGSAPRVLFVAGSAPPDRVEPDVSALTDADLLGWVADWGGTRPELLRDPGFAAAFLPVLRADLEVSRTAHATWSEAERIGIPLVACTGTDDLSATREMGAAWSPWTRGEFELRTFDGGHFFPVTAAKQVLAAVEARMATL
jgi:medium-chain acyl-[acyl-carrier-protein] hydrolase